MKISNEDIISAAKTLRARQESRLTTPENPLKPKRSRTPWIAAAACAAGFLLGFGVHPSASTSSDDIAALKTQTDSLRQEVIMARSTKHQIIRDVVHDTVFQTKIVTREVIREVPVMAKTKEVTENETKNSINNPRHTATVGCSMMCDNISYDLIASKN